MFLPRKLTVAQLDEFPAYMVRPHDQYKTGSFKKRVEHDKKLLTNEMDTARLLPLVVLNMIADYAAHYTCWFEDYVERDKKLLRNEMRATQLFPMATTNMIADYATSYSDEYTRVSLYAMHGVSFLHHYYVDIPLRVSLSSSGETQWSFHHEDAYRAWVQGILNINNFQKWSQLRERAQSGQHESLLSIRRVQRVSLGTTLQRMKPLHLNYSSKSLLSFPLAVYWQNEEEVRFTETSKPILVLLHETFDTTVRDGCYTILAEHNLLKKGMSKKDLVIFCTSCNGQIKDAAKGVEVLLWPHRDIQDKSPFCTGRDERCQTFRALRVFPKQKNSTDGSCIVS